MHIKDEVSSFLHHLVDIDKMGSRTHQLKKNLDGKFLRVLPYRFKDPTNLCRIKPPCTNLMKAFLTPKGLMVKSGELVFSAGKLPQEKMAWIPADHPQFDQAVAWAEGEGLL